MPTNEISVNFEFPGNPPDIHRKPTITTSTDTNTDVPATQQKLEWKATDNTGDANDNLRLTRVVFYRNVGDKNAKRNPYTPPFLDTANAGHKDGDNLTWEISFNSQSVPRQIVLWYDLEWDDADFPDPDPWDPKLTIKPR